MALGTMKAMAAVALVACAASAISTTAAAQNPAVAPEGAPTSQPRILDPVRTGNGLPSDAAAFNYQACRAQSDAAFQAAIRNVTRTALADGLASLDYDAIVREEWRRNELDDVLDKRIDIAGRDVADRFTLLQKLTSLISREQLEEIANDYAERVYRSDVVKDALADLGQGVAAQIGRAITLSSQDAAGPAERCVREFLGPKYGGAISSSVEGDAREAFTVPPEAGAARRGDRSLAGENALALSGAVIFLVRRQIGRLASRLAARLAGTVLTRLVSVVAGGVGVALIAYDIWELRGGMLPLIKAEMKSQSTKEAVRAELAKSVREQVTLQTDTIADETGERILAIWREFKAAHTQVVALAEENEEFKAFTETVGPDRLQRLDEVVSILLETGGRGAVLEALENGRLATAVTRLPDEAMTIARAQRSIEAAIRWSGLAGPLLPAVLDLGLHRRTDPDTFSQATLRRLLRVESRPAQLKLAELPRAARDVLFELNTSKLTALGRNLAVDELRELAGYLTGLRAEASEAVLLEVADNPSKMKVLADRSVREAVEASDDQIGAVRMLLRDNSDIDVRTIQRDLEAVLKWKISPYLVWVRYPYLIFGLGFLVLLVILLVRGIVMTGSRRHSPPRDAASTS